MKVGKPQSESEAVERVDAAAVTVLAPRSRRLAAPPARIADAGLTFESAAD